LNGANVNCAKLEHLAINQKKATGKN